MGVSYRNAQRVGKYDLEGRLTKIMWFSVEKKRQYGHDSSFQVCKKLL